MSKEEMGLSEALATIFWALVLVMVFGIVYWWCAQRLSLPVYVGAYTLGHIVRASVKYARRKK